MAARSTTGGGVHGGGAATAMRTGNRMERVIDHLSPREIEELGSAVDSGALWPRVVLMFVDGTLLRLGWDRALAEGAIATRLGRATAPAAARAACAEATRWCAAHGLHLLSYAGDGPGEDPVGESLWFMAVG